MTVAVSILAVSFCHFAFSEVKTTECLRKTKWGYPSSEDISRHSLARREVAGALLEIIVKLKWRLVIMYMSDSPDMLNAITDGLSRSGIRFIHLSQKSLMSNISNSSFPYLTDYRQNSNTDFTSQNIDNVTCKTTNPVVLFKEVCERNSWVKCNTLSERLLPCIFLHNIQICLQNDCTLEVIADHQNKTKGTASWLKTAKNSEMKALPSGFNLFLDEKSVQKRTLKVGFKQWAPFTIKTVDAGVVGYTGLTVALLNILSEILHFRIEYVDYDDEGWGKLINGSWDGLLGKLQRKEVDLVVPSYSTLVERDDYFDVTYPVRFPRNVVAIYRLPDAEHSIWELSVHLIGWKLLVLTLLSLMSTAINLALTHDVLHTGEVYNSPYWLSHICRATVSKIWYLFGSLLKQGEDGLQPLANRTALTAWCIFCLVVTSTFTATLIASLSASKPWKPFHSADELVGQRDFGWGTVSGGYILYQAQRANKSSVLHGLWKGIQEFSQTDPDVLSSSDSVHFEKVEQGNYAYLTNSAVSGWILAENCNLTGFSVQMPKQQTTLLLQKNCPYRKIFSKWILRLHENGMLDNLSKKWLYPRKTCSRKMTLGEQLDLETVKAVFYLLGFGAAAAQLVLLLEITWACVSAKKKGKHNCSIRAT